MLGTEIPNIYNTSKSEDLFYFTLLYFQKCGHTKTRFEFYIYLFCHKEKSPSINYLSIYLSCLTSMLSPLYTLNFPSYSCCYYLLRGQDWLSRSISTPPPPTPQDEESWRECSFSFSLSFCFECPCTALYIICTYIQYQPLELKVSTYPLRGVIF